MSRSRKKSVCIQDNGMYNAHEYWRVIRREWKQTLKRNYLDEDLYLRRPQEMINDWDYCDWKWRVTIDREFGEFCQHDIEMYRKYSRK